MHFNLKMNWVTYSFPSKLIISLAVLNYKNDLILFCGPIQDDKIKGEKEGCARGRFISLRSTTHRHGPLGRAVCMNSCCTRDPFFAAYG